MTPTKFRASYSVLSAWAAGDYNQAVLSYFHQPITPTPQMEWGRQQHDKWYGETAQRRCLPQMFGGKELTNPKCEQKIVVQLDEWLELVGKPDCYYFEPAGVVLVEYKTGVTDSASYANSLQLPVYQILVPEAVRGEYYHFNQYSGETDMSLIHLTRKTLETALDWVLTYSSEMYHYLITNQLYERFDHAPITE